MTGRCPRCKGREWTCECHPTQPFEHEIDGKECPGPGDPCPECNELSRNYKRDQASKGVAKG